MRITESFRVALDALRANRLRSLLTMLGVVIGVAAVVVLVAIGGGAKQLVTSEVEGLGSNIVFVAPGKFQLGTSPAVSRLQLSDADYLNRVLGRPDAVAVSLASAENLRAGTKTFYATVQGTTANVVDVFDRPVAEGRYVSKADIATARRVIVLGPDAAAALFPDADPIGRQVDDGRCRIPRDRALPSQGRRLRPEPGQRGAHPGHRRAAAVRPADHLRLRHQGRRAPATWTPPAPRWSRR